MEKNKWHCFHKRNNNQIQQQKNHKKMPLKNRMERN